jgi:hypothetical protein
LSGTPVVLAGDPGVLEKLNAGTKSAGAMGQDRIPNLCDAATRAATARRFQEPPTRGDVVNVNATPKKVRGSAGGVT